MSTLKEEINDKIYKLELEIMNLKDSLLTLDDEKLNSITLRIGKDYGIKLKYDNVILDTIEVTDTINKNNKDIYEKKHNDGWTIRAKINYDNYSSISIFEAEHDIYGKIKGDLNKEIIVQSMEAYNHFITNHKLKIIDLASLNI
jgi:hypothetical protein